MALKTRMMFEVETKEMSKADCFGLVLHDKTNCLQYRKELLTSPIISQQESISTDKAKHWRSAFEGCISTLHVDAPASACLFQDGNSDMGCCGQSS